MEIKAKKIISGTNECIDNCSDDPEYKYEYNYKCYKNCSNGFLNDNKCKCELTQCNNECPPVALSKGLCIECHPGYYEINYEQFQYGEYVKCYKNPNGFYLDTTDYLYKRYYSTCETCATKGDNILHNCLTCKNGYPDGIKNDNNYFNCVKLVKTEAIKKSTENINTTEYAQEDTSANNKKDTLEFIKEYNTKYIKMDTTAILISKDFET